jgi:hypothetical protein
MEILKPGLHDKIYYGKFQCINCEATLRVKHREIKEVPREIASFGTRFEDSPFYRYFLCAECGTSNEVNKPPSSLSPGDPEKVWRAKFRCGHCKSTYIINACDLKDFKRGDSLFGNEPSPHYRYCTCRKCGKDTVVM